MARAAESGAAKTASAPPSADKAASPSGARYLILGKIVDGSTWKVQQVVEAQAADFELNLPSQGVAVTVDAGGDYRAYELATGNLLWTYRCAMPYREPQFTGGRLFGLCGYKLVALSPANGEAQEIDGNRSAEAFQAKGDLVVTHESDGTVTAYDAASGELRASRKVSELAYQGFDTAGVLITPDQHVCAYAVAKRNAFQARCMDDALSSLWNVRVVVPAAEGQRAAIHQRGPYHFVLSDEPIAGAETRGHGHGVIVSLKDGALQRFADHTYFTLDNAEGKHTTAPTTMTAARAPFEPTPFDWSPNTSVSHLSIWDGCSYLFLAPQGRPAGVVAIDNASDELLFYRSLPGSLDRVEHDANVVLYRSALPSASMVVVIDDRTGEELYVDKAPRH